MTAHALHPGIREDRVRLGLSIPDTVGRAGRSLEWARTCCLGAGISTVEVSLDALETVLGVPIPAAPIEPPPVDGLAFGLLDLEEDVLRDSYDLAKQTFDTQVRTWRATASLTPLVELRRTWQQADISIGILRVPDLVVWSDAEVDYACRVARAVGARTLATGASLAGPRRLAPVAHRHNIQPSFANDQTTGAAELSRLLQHDDAIAVSIEIDAWTQGGHGSPLPFLVEHAHRVSHVRMKDVSPGAVADVLCSIRDNAWAFPAVLAIDSVADDWPARVRQAIDSCHAVLT